MTIRKVTQWDPRRGTPSPPQAFSDRISTVQSPNPKANKSEGPDSLSSISSSISFCYITVSITPSDLNQNQALTFPRILGKQTVQFPRNDVVSRAGHGSRRRRRGHLRSQHQHWRPGREP
ncbi:hypothetical protein SLA2020_281130 [Shorea laevis]